MGMVGRTKPKREGGEETSQEARQEGRNVASVHQDKWKKTVGRTMGGRGAMAYISYTTQEGAQSAWNMVDTSWLSTCMPANLPIDALNTSSVYHQNTSEYYILESSY